MIEYLVIPAAGYGTRVRSITQGWHKEFLSISGKPVIHHVVYSAFAAGIKKFVIIIRKGKEDIEEYFTNIDFAEKLFPSMVNELKKLMELCSINFVYQKEPRGECDAIYCAWETVGNRPFLVIYPDNFIYPYPDAINFLIRCFFKYNCDVLGLKNLSEEMLEEEIIRRIKINNFTDNSWIIESISDNKASAFKENSYSKSLTVSGIYIAKPHYFDFIKKGLQNNPKGELNDHIIRNLMIEDGITLLGIRLPGMFFDVGSPEGYIECKKYLDERC